ncbi:MAG: efflux RND transporter permease subunit [Planctomycetes bacterium]|nr:efflux RND transporter permease subunit [Planctomycetota bacterium]
MSPIEAAVRRPYTVAVATILAVLFGLVALQRIPVQLKPQVDKPKITITTAFRGASAIEVEEQLTRELEEVLQSTEGLVEMTSVSSEGQSSVTLEFEYGTDTQLAVVDVINKLSRVERLPDEADEPAVDIDSGDNARTVMWLAVVSGFGPDQVRRIVEEDIKAQIERVEGVASLFIAGGSEREIQVRIDPEALVARGVSVQELLDAIAAGNVNVAGGTIETTGRQLVVRTVGRAALPAGLSDLIVKEGEGGSVRLGELAEIVDGFREASGFVNIDGTPGVALGVRRQADANVVDLIGRLDDVVAKLNKVFTNRGIDVFLTPVYRETTYIESALSFVTNNLLMGAALAVVVLAVFLRSVRSVLIVALSIPLSLVVVFLVIQASGRTLNVITLAGIAFASGMVVDNAIVVLENVFRHLESGKGPLRAAIEGGHEVWGGILASTLTTVAVFLPILTQSDEASDLFVDMALAISAAVMLSLVVALTVVPVLCSLMFRGKRFTEKVGHHAHALTDIETGMGFVGRAYDRFTESLSTRGGGATAGKLGICLLVLAVALASLRLMPPAEYLPTGNRNLVFFFAEPIPGTRPEAVSANFKPFEDFVLAQPEASRMFAVTGPNFNGGGAVLKDEYADAKGLDSFHKRLYGPAATLPGFRFVVPVRSSLFEDPGKQFEVEISGPELDDLERAATRLGERLQQVPGVEFVRSSLVTGRPQVTVTIDENRAKDLGLDVSDVGTVVAVMLQGRRTTALIDGGREVEINVVAPQTRIESTADLASMRFLDGQGRVIDLASVAKVERSVGPQSIRRLERERNVLLTVNIGKDAPLETVVSTVEDDVFPELAQELGPAYTLGVGGSADKLHTTLHTLSGGFGFSVLIVYLLLVALFKSWGTPIVILVTVPLALTGGLIGIRVAHELSGGEASFDVIAMLGFVILAGLVVNNAILIVHQANNFRDEGIPPRRALMLSARSRLRPIAMTIITTVFGMLPLALGGGAGAELYQGLGAVIVGGLVLSTLFTLFLVPAMLSLGHDLRGAPSLDDEVGLGTIKATAAPPASAS